MVYIFLLRRETCHQPEGYHHPTNIKLGDADAKYVVESHNIIVASTGTANAVGKIIPELNGKLTCMAF
ncbi:hypothetical protein A6R68_05647, partial [Neotoma lepida]